MAAPLDEDMLTLDVANTLRRRVEAGAGPANPMHDAELVQTLQAEYEELGIAVSEDVIQHGIRAFAENRFAGRRSQNGIKNRLALLYVSRQSWGRPVAGVIGAILLAVAGYVLVYLPVNAWQAEQARIEIEETLPARIDALYQAIFTETKVQSALAAAQPWVRRGNAAAERGDRNAALAATEELERIHAMLVAEFTLRIVDREGESTGVWRFPEAASDATNYYIVVEPIGPDGQALSLPIRSEETGEIAHVDTWAVRVPEVTYDSIRADRLSDGVIHRNIMGIKQYGFLDIEYLMPVLGGAITEW